jgi:hypothetical protein
MKLKKEYYGENVKMNGASRTLKLNKEYNEEKVKTDGASTPLKLKKCTTWKI